MSETSSDPKLIHLEYSYSSAKFPFDEAIVRRIRFDADEFFVPVVKVEVFQYPTGGTREFIHWGYGSEWRPGIPILDAEVYGAPKPFFGYLSEIGRASFVSPWVQGPPFLPSMPEDGTPGETVPFDERAYIHAIDCLNEMKLREARFRKQHGNAAADANAIPGVRDDIRQMAYLATHTRREDRIAAAKKEKDSEWDKVRYVLKEDKRHHQSFTELTDDDLGLMAEFWRRDGDMKNAASIGLSQAAKKASAPAKPGGIVVVPY